MFSIVRASSSAPSYNKGTIPAAAWVGYRTPLIHPVGAPTALCSENGRFVANYEGLNKHYQCSTIFFKRTEGKLLPPFCILPDSNYREGIKQLRWPLWALSNLFNHQWANVTRFSLYNAQWIIVSPQDVTWMTYSWHRKTTSSATNICASYIIFYKGLVYTHKSQFEDFSYIVSKDRI